MKIEGKQYACQKCNQTFPLTDEGYVACAHHEEGCLTSMDLVFQELTRLTNKINQLERAISEVQKDVNATSKVEDSYDEEEQEDYPPQREKSKKKR
jgi:hypothetical protein